MNFVLDTNVVIEQLRGNAATARFLLNLLAAGHFLCTTGVTIAEIERGVLPKDRRRTKGFLDRLRFLATDREAASRAGIYQREFALKGRPITLADALVAGTARRHGAVVLTSNARDFPMRDLRVEVPPIR